MNDTTFILSTKVYDFLKPVAQIVLPAAASLYFGLSTIWDLPAGEQVVGTISLVDVFLGAILGISTKQYNESDAAHDGALLITEDGGGMKNATLQLDGDPEDLSGKKSVSFKIQTTRVP